MWMSYIDTFSEGVKEEPFTEQIDIPLKSFLNSKQVFISDIWLLF